MARVGRQADGVYEPRGWPVKGIQVPGSSAPPRPRVAAGLARPAASSTSTCRGGSDESAARTDGAPRGPALRAPLARGRARPASQRSRASRTRAATAQGPITGCSVNQPVADSPSVSGAFRRIGSLCRRGFAPESPRTAPVFASTRPPRRPLRGPVRRFRVAGTTAPDPIAFVQHAATCAGIPARCRYRGHALPRMAPFGPGLHHVVAAVRDSEHGPSVGGWSTPREGRPVGPGVRRLPRDQALEAPAAAVGVHRSRARGAVRLAGE